MLLISARLLLATSVLMTTACSKAIPSVACGQSSPGTATYRVLVLGESWAGGGRLFPALYMKASQRAGTIVRACSFGFSGNNSRKLLAHDIRAEAVRRLGGPPTHVLILNGVNDQIQHRGAENYASETEALLKTASRATAQAVEMPITNPWPDLAVHIRIRSRLVALLHPESRSAYIAALHRRVPAYQLIPYEPFSQGWLIEPARYAKDGIHLTKDQFQVYGAYIGSRMLVEQHNSSPHSATPSRL